MPAITLEVQTSAPNIEAQVVKKTCVLGENADIAPEYTHPFRP